MSNVIGVPFSPAVVDQVAKVPGVAAVARFRYVTATAGGAPAQVGAIEPIPFAKAMKVRMDSGTIGALAGQTVRVESKLAKARGLVVGDKVTISIAGKAASYPVVGIFEGFAGISSQQYLTSLEALSAAGVVPADNLAFVVRAPGANPAGKPCNSPQRDRVSDRRSAHGHSQGPVRAHCRATGAHRPDAEPDLRLARSGRVIAVLGIVNTLALSVIERIREMGLLRALGLSRRQLRTMVRLESIISALLGAVLGVGLGLVFGIALQRSQADSGIEVLSVPFVQLLIFVVLAGLVGVLAAVWQARRAAKLDVLRAITTD